MEHSEQILVAATLGWVALPGTPMEGSRVTRAWLARWRPMLRWAPP